MEDTISGKCNADSEESRQCEIWDQCLRADRGIGYETHRLACKSKKNRTGEMVQLPYGVLGSDFQTLQNALSFHLTP
jgi:hypothetical protein